MVISPHHKGLSAPISPKKTKLIKCRVILKVIHRLNFEINAVKQKDRSSPENGESKAAAVCRHGQYVVAIRELFVEGSKGGYGLSPLTPPLPSYPIPFGHKGPAIRSCLIRYISCPT